MASMDSFFLAVFIIPLSSCFGAILPPVQKHISHHGQPLHNLQPVGGLAVVQMLVPTTPANSNSTATFGNGILPTARQPGIDWPFTSTTSRARVLSAKAPPIISSSSSNNRTINYTAYFDNFEAKFKDSINKHHHNHLLLKQQKQDSSAPIHHQMQPNKLIGETACDVSPLETVKMLLLLQHGTYLATVLKPTLVAKRQMVIVDKTFDFNITLQLHKWNSTNKVVLGAQITQTLTEGRYNTANPSIILRWPIEYRELVKFDSSYNLADPKSTTSKLAIDVTVVLTQSSGAIQPATISTRHQRPPPAFARR